MEQVALAQAGWRAERDGSARAFSVLYESLAPRVHAFFMRSFRNPALAEDLLQQTFMRAHKARASYRGEASPKSWLFAIAARVRIDELRQRMRRPTLVEEQLDAIDDDGHRATATPATDTNPAERAELRAGLAAAFERLPESQRVVLHLHRFEGLSFAEIGAVLNTSEGAVRVRAFRALATLRELLEPYLGDET